MCKFFCFYFFELKNKEMVNFFFELIYSLGMLLCRNFNNIFGVCCLKIEDFGWLRLC